MEYFIDVAGEHKTHSLRVIANYTPGRSFVSRPRNEEEFLAPSEPDEVDIQEVYLYNESQEKRLEPISDCLLEEIETKIIEQENGDKYVV